MNARSPTAPLPHAHGAPTATSIDDGQVLAVDGARAPACSSPASATCPKALPSTALSALFPPRSSRRASAPRTRPPWNAAVVAVALASGSASASEPLSVIAPSVRGAAPKHADAPTVTNAGPEAPPAVAPLHLSASPFVEVLSRGAGVEVGVSVALGPYLDVGAAAMLGPSVGGRLTFNVHPGPDWRLKPLLQLRGAVHPVSAGTVLGGGVGLGASFDVGPGRVTGLAVGEAYSSVPSSPSYGVFAMLGYQVDLDLFRPPSPGPRALASAEPAPSAPPAPKAPSAPPAAAAKTVAAPVAVVAKASAPEKAKEPDAEKAKVTLRTDDLPPPFFSRPAARPPPPTVAAQPASSAPAPSAGKTRVSVQIAIRERIYFAEDRSRLRSKYLPVLKQVANLLKRYPMIKKVRIDGYADDGGSAQVDLQLSEFRAQSVRDFLVKNGVEPSRLEIRAGGRPPRGSENAEERRRVGFTILDPPQNARAGP